MGCRRPRSSTRPSGTRRTWCFCTTTSRRTRTLPVGYLPVFGKISAKCCSFSAVSAPIFATKYAFCSIFQNLPDFQAEIFEIWQYFANFATFAKFLLNFHENCCFFKPIFCENFEIAAVQKNANLVELEKSSKLLSNAHFHVFSKNRSKFRFDTAENEPAKNIAKNC